MHLDGARWSPPLPGSTPALVGKIEITSPLTAVPAFGYRWGYFLVTAHGLPAGWITCPVTNGRCTPREIRAAILSTLATAVLARLLEHRLGASLRPGGLTRTDLFAALPPRPDVTPFLTVAVCTKDRPADLEHCLRSLACVDYPLFEVIVVDNASTTPATRDLVAMRHPAFRYVREERPGLDWARNRAIEAATGEIIVFTDDDVVVDSAWLKRIAARFEDPTVAAVTGLIGPLELRCDPQLHFEAIGGFGRGCTRAWHRIDSSGTEPDVYHFGAGRFGAGANMAFRSAVLKSLGGFDPALDVGTATEGGGDLDAFLRVLHEGGTLVYEPAALVWHRHRATDTALHAQIATWGTAIGALLTAAYCRYPGSRMQILRFAMVWSWLGYLGPLVRHCLGPGRVPRRLRARPLARLLLGPLRYLRARKLACTLGAPRIIPPPVPAAGPQKIGVREIDLDHPIEPLVSLKAFRACMIHVSLAGKFIGTLTIENRTRDISVAELRTRIADDLTEALLPALLASDVLKDIIRLDDLLGDFLMCDDDLAADDFVPELASVVVATRNRPDQLRRCLASLAAQMVDFPFEVVVVDNDPDSGLTAPVVQAFPLVRYVAERLQGLSQARNTGFRAASGDILVATDDDVVAPPGWLREIVQPFRFAHIGIATGLVAPLCLDHRAQRDFEAVGGLGKGRREFEVGLDWLSRPALQPPRAWDIGATANAAFRRSMLQDPRVGLLPESLGPGTPAGGGEDAYLFYRAVRTGYGACYEPQAMVLHEHRADDVGLRTQMIAYSKGHVSYLLTTLARDGDLRALLRLLTVLPFWHLSRLCARPGRLRYRRRLVLAEVAGYLLGPCGWINARRRDARAHRDGRPSSRQPLGTASADMVELEVEAAQ